MTARKVVSVISGILLILMGFSCFATPVETSTILPLLLGIVMMASGVGRTYAWFKTRYYYSQSGWTLAGAIGSAVFGLMLAASPAMQISLNLSIMVLTGLWFAVMGIIRIIRAYQLRKYQRDYDNFWGGFPMETDWRAPIIPGVIFTLIGLALILEPEIGLGIISAVIGLGVIVSGVTMLFFGSLSWGI